MDTPYRQRRRIVPRETAQPTNGPQPRTPLGPISANTPARPLQRPSIPPPAPGNLSAPGSAVKTLRIAFQDTPPQLRELEAAWRRRRAEKLDAATVATTPRPASTAVAMPDTRGRRVRFGHSDETPLVGTASDVDFVAVSSFGESDMPVPSPSPAVVAAQPAVAGFPPTPPSSPPPFSARTMPTNDVLRTGSSHSPSPEPHSSRSPLRDPLRHRRSSDSPGRATPVPLLQPSRLPPTSTPIPLGRNNDTLIVNPPSYANALVFSLQNGRTRVRVSRDGDAAAVSTLRRGERTRFTLRHCDHATWSELECKLWYRLSAMLETAEARTPRVKLFTAMGDLVITCSDPPDIILSFSNNILPDDSVAPAEGGRRQKARVLYSRKSGTVTIDTASKATIDGGSGSSKLRTRRTAELDRIDGAATGHDNAAALGILLSDDWSELECEAVRRLVGLREEWERAAQQTLL